MNTGEVEDGVTKYSAVGGTVQNVSTPVQCLIPLCTVQQFTLPYVIVAVSSKVCVKHGET